MTLKKIGGGTANAVFTYITEKGGQALILVPLEEESPKGGSRWYKGVTPYG